MLKLSIESNRNVSFPDLHSLDDHMLSHVELSGACLTLQFAMLPRR